MIINTDSNSILSSVYDQSFVQDNYVPVRTPHHIESVRPSPPREDDFDRKTQKPGSYISQEERTFFERCQNDNFKEDLEHYKVEVSSLQHQLRRTSEQVLSYERIHHDLEERLEKVTKEKINLGKKFSNTNRESLKQLAKAVEEKGDWEKRYNKQSLRCQALSETIRNLEKELYMMHLRKYEFMKTSEESTRRSGGLPFPINVSSLSFDKKSSVISDDDRLKLAQEQEAARIVANCSPSSEDPNPVHALARELALQRGKGQLIKNLSVFFGCV